MTKNQIIEEEIKQAIKELTNMLEELNLSEIQIENDKIGRVKVARNNYKQQIPNISSSQEKTDNDAKNENLINEDKENITISATHNAYLKKFGYLHKRSIKISKNEDKIFGYDELKKTKKYLGLLNYFIRFHVYPDTKIVKTTAGNSILISLSNGEGWSLLSETNNFEIEKNIFFGNKSRIINNESISMSGKITKEIVSVKWVIERVN